MSIKSMAISVGGARRLRAAIEEQVRREFQQQLAQATEHRDKAVVEQRIKEEVDKRMERVASPQSLWGIT